MSPMGRTAALLLLCCATLLPLFAQEGENSADSGIPGEAERRNRQAVAAAQAQLPNPENQMQALELLESMLQSGDAAFVARNEEIVTSLLLPPRVADSPGFRRSFPQIRIRAAELAARLDTRRSAETLTTLLSDDPDPAVQAAAARLLPGMESADPAAVAAALGKVLRAENAGNRRDNRLVTSIVQGAYTLYRRWGTEDALLIRNILELREGPYSRETRQIAGRFVELLLED